MADSIDDALTSPQSVTTPAGSVTARKAEDLIALDRYAEAKAARGTLLRGLMMNKIIPAAAPADQQGTNQSGEFDQGL